MDTKVTGYGLLVIGIGLIVWATISVYGVFTGRAAPYKLFEFDGIGLDLSSLVPAPTIDSSQPPEVRGLPTEYGPQVPSSQKTEVVPPNLLNDTTNVFFHLVLMGFVSGAGFKIASLGTQLVRPVKVNLHESPRTPLPKAAQG